MPTIGEIVLFVRALPLARAAQAVKVESVPKVVERMGARGRGIGTEDAVRAAQRACNRWGRWFGGLSLLQKSWWRLVAPISRSASVS
jgi:hypothetical protein